MSSWRKFKSEINQKVIKVRPIHNQKELKDREQIGIGIDIEGNEVILNDTQIKDLICYLLHLSWV